MGFRRVSWTGVLERFQVGAQEGSWMGGPGGCPRGAQEGVQEGVQDGVQEGVLDGVQEGPASRCPGVIPVWWSKWSRRTLRSRTLR